MNSTLPDHSIIRLKALTQLTGLSRSTIYEKQNHRSSRYDPTFPQKIHLGARAVGWFKWEIESWLQSVRKASL